MTKDEERVCRAFAAVANEMLDTTHDELGGADPSGVHWAWDEDQDGLEYFLPQARELLAALAPQRARRLNDRDARALRVLDDGERSRT